MNTLMFITLGLLAMALLTKRHLPRGIRNNNPGNIRRNAIQWKGMQAVQNDKAFVQFISPEYGFRAMVRILRSYQGRGLNSVREIIRTYAPATENKTENYINFVAGRLSVKPNDQLEVESRMSELIQAITVFENGPLYADFYELAAIDRGIALA